VNLFMSADPAAAQSRWNTEARVAALAEFGSLTVKQVDEQHSPGTAGRWLAEAKVFAVEGPDGSVLPAFQLHDGEPLPVISKVLVALADQLRGWEILLWFTGSDGHLDGARPVDLIVDAPDAVVDAAAYQAALSMD
jgi:hypothetical protein